MTSLITNAKIDKPEFYHSIWNGLEQCDFQMYFEPPNYKIHGSNSFYEQFHSLYRIMHIYNSDFVYILTSTLNYTTLRRIQANLIQSRRKCLTYFHAESFTDSQFSKVQAVDLANRPDLVVLLHHNADEITDWSFKRFCTQIVVPFLMISSFTEVRMFMHCPNCEYRGTSRIYNVTGQSWKTISEFWINERGDFKRGIISTIGYHYSIWKGSSEFCDDRVMYKFIAGRSRISIPASAQECAIRAVGKNHNLSYILTDKDPGLRGPTTISVLSFMTQLHSKSSQFDREMLIEHPMIFDRVTYFATIELHERYLKALLRPFDWQTWLGFGITFFLISLFFLKLKLGAMAYFCGVVDQGVSNLDAKINNRSMVYGVWVLLALCAMILTNSYRGKMFAFMRKQDDPKYPDSLESLNGIGVEVYAFPGISMSQGFDGIRTAINDTLNGRNVSNLLNKMQKNLICGFGPYVRDFFVASQYKDEHIKSLQNPEKISNFPKFAKEYVVVDTKQNCLRFKTFLKVFTHKWISPMHELHGMFLKYVWTVQRNSYRPVIASGLMHLFGGGLNGKWESLRLKYLSMKELYETKECVELNVDPKVNEKLRIPEKQWPQSLHSDFSLEDVGLKPISNHLLRVIWFCYVMLSMLAPLALVVEVLIFIGYKNTMEEFRSVKRMKS
ncbi:unnamed protein product [Orchesella dallaii]|uniref:Uncharacterized protein n=1 Tax=Orchesella dallaii TaxID=48710 RepID=A0ABP1R5W0_9HEXA